MPSSSVNKLFAQVRLANWITGHVREEKEVLSSLKITVKSFYYKISIKNGRKIPQL